MHGDYLGDDFRNGCFLYVCMTRNGKQNASCPENLFCGRVRTAKHLNSFRQTNCRISAIGLHVFAKQLTNGQPVAYFLQFRGGLALYRSA
jgi:uncharacterized protein YjhX (UPF0386 family)